MLKTLVFSFSLLLEMEASKQPVSAKQLKEHLQHQQEPFSLHNYLSERRFSLNNFSPSVIDYHLRPSEKTLKWWINDEKHKMRRRFLHASAILRSLLYKFVPFGDQNQKLSNCVGIAASDDHYTHEDGEGNGLNCHDYSPKLVNMFQFHSFTLPNLRRLEVDSGAKPHWASTVEEQWEQPILPNAVCAFRSHEDPVTAFSTFSQKSDRDPIFSTYLRKLLINPNILRFTTPKKHKLHHTVGTPPTRHKNTRTHRKSKQQVLFGCVEKAREFQESKEKRHGEAEKITHFLHAESCVALEDWKDLHKLSRDIHVEIGDDIMDDMVKEMLYALVD